ncbi:MAG: transcription antitermination factor NusB [Clostridia bacterium]|nr:transcription antitermination factor NusB [Clostridia bacterium]
MTRRESREAAMRFVFEQEFDIARTPDEIMLSAREDRGEDAVGSFAEQLFRTVSDNTGDIDEKIADASQNWKFDRIGKVTLAVLRVACAELFWFPEIPVEVTLNEALEIARKYDDEKSLPFINGVLGRLTQGLEKPEARKKPEDSE